MARQSIAKGLVQKLALCMNAALLLQPVYASSAPAPAVASRSDEQWEVATSGDAIPLKMDGKAVQATSGRHVLNKLTPGIHTVEIGTSPPLTLLIRESGTRTSDAPQSPTRAFKTVVEDPKLRRPAPTLRVMQGEVVQLDVSSAAAADVHLHGYDILGRVGPGMPLSIAFDANLAGRFSFETHGQAHNSFAFLEVLPR